MTSMQQKNIPSKNASNTSEKMTLEWGHSFAEKLWEGLYSRYNPFLTNKTVLDFGCSWGYVLKFISEIDAPKRLIGFDLADLWFQMKDKWDYESNPFPMEFHKQDICENRSIPSGSVDLVLSTSVLQYIAPDHLERTLDKIYSLLKPGGEFLLRTRCFTSYIGADFHTAFSDPYLHLLQSGKKVDSAYFSKVGRKPRYLNTLTASSYVALFHRAGFEILDLNFRMNKQEPDRMKKVSEKWSWISEDELNVAEIEARLIVPLKGRPPSDEK